ncbi:hypothetical protein HJG54_04365 [Leptolyngbya sp. NK1-12]|uniref:Uncharacterized protein n=1 Tax=Leptolyngbya sp. NK1-12 TaxID=2547451 RepID=A0AA97AIU6_9CYAN|nr:hypothetical protein [Leptolyngbya sp. NK1-12]WNZ22172.1 hypothetical protein HJG54_04365 [Leptolyngbya sp. NK1-12]
MLIDYLLLTYGRSLIVSINTPEIDILILKIEHDIRVFLTGSSTALLLPLRE